MRLLTSRELADVGIERTFRPGRVGPTVLAALLWGLLAVPVVLRAELARAIDSVPWYVWVASAPILLLAGLIGVLVLHGTAEFARNAWRKSAWSARTAWDGVYLNLRSWQNAHFPDDGPTIVFLPWSELARASKLVEHVDRGTARRAPPARRWVVLELAGVETRELEALLRAEATRPGPERTFLGLRSRGRYHHTPVVVPEDGVVQVEWLGPVFLRELARRITTSTTPRVERIADATRPIEDRIAELVQRGDPLTAIELARREGGLSLLEAKELVDACGRRAA
ncbi:MAG: hypothetical protein IPJ77_00975 [Planctomycetes bacterium]|nr:hypothetical protein [Planctomycetota bacterium]